MIPKSIRLSFCLILILALVLSWVPVSTVQAATGPVNSNTGTRELPCTELSTQALAYYTHGYEYEALCDLSGRSSPTDSYVATLGNPLYTALHTLMEDTHEVSTVYNGYEPLSLATCWLKTDAEAGSDTYLYFYTGRLRSELESTTLNREHVWPKSKASYYQINGGADLHHLRPSISSVNLAKSDHCFMDIPDDAYGRTTSNIEGQVVLELLKSDGKVEVRDSIKGDIARILLYVYCRWEQPNLYSDVSTGNLPALDKDDDSNKGTRAIQDLDTLLRWCEMDPVDQWEMGRNDQTENIQGNRNVFIDYPELAWLMFGMEPPTDMITPSGKAAQGRYEVTFSVNDSSLGSATIEDLVITATPARHALLEGYSLVSGSAEITQEGNTFTVTPSSDCHVQILFREKDRVTLTFNGASAVTGHKGDTVILPDALTTPEGYSFVGWTTEQVKDSTAPGSYLQVGSSYTLTEDLTFYPLYSYTKITETGNGDYKKVTTAPTDWSGDYILVYESGKYAFNGSLANPNTYNNCRSVTVTNGTVPYTQAHSLRVTLALRSDGSYSIRTASGVYLGSTGSYSGLSYGASDQYSNALSLNSNGTVTITAPNGSRLGFMPTLRRFQYFSSNTGYNAIALYRRETDAVTTYYTTELPLDESIEIRHSLNLASDISINYVVAATQLNAYDSFYLECKFPLYDGDTLTGNRTVRVEPVLNSVYYYFTLTGVTAVNMADEISATLIMERDGQTYTSAEDIYSVSTYAYNQLNKDTSAEQLKALCAELLRYGSTAQIYKAYRTASLADSAMTETHRSYLRELDSVPFGSTNTVLNDLLSPAVTWAGKALSLESKVVLRFIINTADYNGKAEDLHLHITYTDYAGNRKSVTLTNCTVYDSARSYYAFDFDGLLAAELRSDVSVAVYHGDTRVSQTMEYSAATYGSNKTGSLRALCQALLAYSDAAADQFS